MKQFLILLRRELRAVTREKTIMFAIMIQFVIASLSSILLIGIMAFYDPSTISQNTNAHIRVGLVQDESNPMARFLTEKGIRVKEYSDVPTAKEAFRAGDVDAVMQIPSAKSGVVDMQLVLPVLDTGQTVVLMVLQEPLKKYENYLREYNGIHVNYADMGGKPSNSYEFLYSLIIPILMLFPALITGSIIIDTISEEFENKTLETLFAAPVSLKQVFSAKLAAAVITAVGQIVLWIVLLSANGTKIHNTPSVIVFAVTAAAMVAFLAAFVALYFKDRERSQFIYSLVLVVVAAGSYFLGFSPVNVITGMASGSVSGSLPAFVVYAAILLVLGQVFFKYGKKLVFKKR